MNNKLQAAQEATKLVQSGMVLGLGTGSTTAYFVNLLGEKLQRGDLQNIVGVPTSEKTAQLAGQLRIPLTTLSQLVDKHYPPVLDLAVDGADEVDPNLNLIKGLGHALLREKIIEIHARELVIIVDESKQVMRLGRGPLPVEITPFEAQLHVHWLSSLGCRSELWLTPEGTPIVTDNGNFLVRCWFENGIPDASDLATQLAEQPGIVEHGLFLNMADKVIIAGLNGIQILERG